MERETFSGHIMPKFGDITPEYITKFFEGSDPMEHIVSIELGYNECEAEIIYYDSNNIKRIKKEPFKPFLWAKNSACVRMFGGQRGTLRAKMREYGIKVKALYTCTEDNPYPHEKLQNGYKYLFYTTSKMSMGRFQNFFNEAGTPIKKRKKEEEEPSSQEFMVLQPVEQFMIETGKRFFKGYDNYDDVKRMSFDIETEGLNPKIHHISQIGIRTNKGYEKILTITGDTIEEKEENEIKAIIEFTEIIAEEKPDVIFGHNTENFDWDFIIVRCQQYGIDYKELSSRFLREGIYKKKHPTTLKLGGEVETYFATVLKYHNVVDSLHAVRRAMATDSSFESANLKYATKYLKLNKQNRVYVPGNLIDSTWLVTEPIYAFNDSDGDWYKYDPSCDFKLKTIEEFKNEIKTYPSYEDYKIGYLNSLSRYDRTPTEEALQKSYNEEYIFDVNILYERYIKSLKGLTKNGNFKVRTMNILLDGYKLVSGKYIVERYLLDDIWEADKVELSLHETDFQLTKIMPTTFMRVCTMGTATQWKLILLNWSYLHGLAIPSLGKNKKYTGGLSRLLVTGYMENIVKYDYAALYPTTQLTWNIEPATDFMHVTLPMLKYVLTQREAEKALKKKSEKAAENLYNVLKGMSSTDENYENIVQERNLLLADKINHDNQQLVLKKLANSWFGSMGCPGLNPWGDLGAAEKTTCIGRQLLRVMICHLKKLGYIPIVGDSVTGDTPLFTRDKKTNQINILPIEEMVNEKYVDKDAFGREYDNSEKPYQVLCRSGWSDVNYLYRHETTKPIYRVDDGNSCVDVTEDHSLFNDKQEEIKPSQITPNTKLEYNKHDIWSDFNTESIESVRVRQMAKFIITKMVNCVPQIMLNANIESKKIFIDTVKDTITLNNGYSKAAVAGVMYIKKCIKNNE